jgi:sugar diacid utilization regulator
VSFVGSDVPQQNVPQENAAVAAHVVGVLAEVTEDPRPIVRDLMLEGIASSVLAAPVMLGDGCAGWLAVCTTSPPDLEQLQLLQIGAASVAVVLAHERTLLQVELRARGELLHALLDATLDVATIRRRAAGAGVDLGGVSAVAVIRLPERTHRAAQHLNLATVIRETDAWAGDHGDEVVLLASGPSAETLAQQLRSSASDFGRATVGVAACEGGIEGTRQAYVSARQTAAVLHALDHEGRVAVGGELGVYQGLLSHAGRGDLRTFVEATIGALIRNDEERGRALTQTVSTYVANAQHHARTCAQLNIHANTLYARLERVSELLGPTWRDPDRLLEIHLALRLHGLLIRT